MALVTLNELLFASFHRFDKPDLLLCKHGKRCHAFSKSSMHG
jgi:hypothetical protein